MSNLINMEFLMNPSEFDDFSLHSSIYFNDEFKSLGEDTSLNVTGSDNVTMDYDYTSNLDEDSGKTDRSTSLKLSDYNIISEKGAFPILLKEKSSFDFEKSLLINKIEFDRENGGSVSVKVEFQADNKEDAENIKNKAKAYGIAVK
ncbi:MAG: hypothetical protein MUP48_02200 [Wolbachia endosymbiont of Homalodisca vitripennis]|nr:hypothetical protein [Wolbachia endosymbiont of Homalodisca vitripennis]MCJ7476047.1 hypothetical protein [Wolbachia endosymbiont of Homalodisca vitripennis]